MQWQTVSIVVLLLASGATTALLLAERQNDETPAVQFVIPVSRIGDVVTYHESGTGDGVLYEDWAEDGVREEWATQYNYTRRFEVTELTQARDRSGAIHDVVGVTDIPNEEHPRRPQLVVDLASRIDFGYNYLWDEYDGETGASYHSYHPDMLRFSILWDVDRIGLLLQGMHIVRDMDVLPLLETARFHRERAVAVTDDLPETARFTAQGTIGGEPALGLHLTWYGEYDWVFNETKWTGIWTNDVVAWFTATSPYPVRIESVYDESDYRIEVDGARTVMDTESYRSIEQLSLATGEGQFVPWQPTPDASHFGPYGKDVERGPVGHPHPVGGSGDRLTTDFDAVHEFAINDPTIVLFHQWQSQHPNRELVGIEYQDYWYGHPTWILVFGDGPTEFFFLRVINQEGAMKAFDRFSGTEEVSPYHVQFTSPYYLPDPREQAYVTLSAADQIARLWVEESRWLDDPGVHYPLDSSIERLQWGVNYYTLLQVHAKDQAGEHPPREAWISDPRGRITLQYQTRDAWMSPEGIINLAMSYSGQQERTYHYDTVAIHAEDGYLDWASYYANTSYASISPLQQPEAPESPPALVQHTNSPQTWEQDVVFWSSTGLTITGLIGAALIFARYLVANGFFGSGYAKVHGPALLNHPLRSELNGWIQRHPGINISELRVKTEAPASTIVHHLRKMERDGLVYAMWEGRNRRYFVNGAVGYSRAKQLAILQNNGTARVLALLRRGPAKRQDLASSLDMTAMGVSWHLARLKEAGLVAATKEGRAMVYRARVKPTSPISV